MICNWINQVVKRIRRIKRINEQKSKELINIIHLKIFRLGLTQPLQSQLLKRAYHLQTYCYTLSHQM
jgi:predicted nucleic acid-binding protein